MHRAPKPDESFEELFARARVLERHEQQFGASRWNNARGKSTTLEGGSTKGDRTTEQRTGISSKGPQCQKGLRQEFKGVKTGHPRFFPDETKKSEAWYNCGDLGHHWRDCPKLGREAPGRTGRVSSMTVRKFTNQFQQFSTDELETVLTERKAATEQQQLEGSGNVDMVTVSSVGVKGPLLKVNLEVEGLPVQAVVRLRTQIQNSVSGQ